MKRRVVVTGLGLVSCLGHDYATVIRALRRGSSGVRAMPEWREHGLKSLVAGRPEGLEEKKQDARLPKKLAPGMSEAALHCSLAARDAVADAGLEDADLGQAGTGCIVGSGTGGVETVHRAGDLYYSDRLRRIDPYTVLRAMSSSASAAVSNLLGIRGRSYSLSSACATSAHNIGHARELIAGGLLDRAVAGGGEGVSELITASFQALRLALSTRYNDTPERASRPYDAGRDGFVVSGGGGIVVIEELEAAKRRGARMRAEILGHGANSDAFDLVLPQPDGERTAECMRAALTGAGVEPEEVDYVNTHGTGTVHGDVSEVRALQRVFGERVPPFSSTKSMTGHALGAAGALELIFSIGMLEEGFLAPSINVENLDPAFEGLPIVTTASDRRPRTILSNNFGFGGTNSSLVIRSFSD
ncbi:MAG: beta-ketoacyl-[acyl-carrier-protein] synthase family protein [bacterium]|nr:beta-ketoacyl-[acyl-carrier-protein] synthase family protein [bacterium]